MPNDFLSAKVVILDDDEQYLNLLQTICEEEGFTTIAVSDAFEFLARQFTAEDLIILDLSLPGIDGIEILRVLSEKKCESRLIFVSGQDRGVLRAAEDLAKARSLNYIATLSKPVKISQLRDYLSAELGIQKAKKAQHKKTEAEWFPSAEELEYAIKHNQITAYYQPQICLFNDALYGVEALARWDHPEYGVISPIKFIPLAEETGLIVQMTDVLVRRCIEDIRCLSEKGHRNVNLSINISASHIHNYALPEVLLNLVSENHIEANSLTLEITESGLMTELITSLDILTRLRLKGFNLSIDDFGTGYSSLYQLHKMPFNELKVDQAFVKEMARDPDSLSIVETCIMLAKKLGMLTVAEGIEDYETYAQLKKLGCDYAQGYFIAKPMPIEELNLWHETWKSKKYEEISKGARCYG